MIKHSAILIKGKVYTGTTHSEIIFDLVTNKKAKLPLEGEQGFVTDKGKFLSREDAAIEALQCGQITKLSYCTTRLFSEDLIKPEKVNYKILKRNPSKQAHNK